MPRKQKTNRPDREPQAGEAAGRDTEVRIIGGEFRGRRLHYHGDPVVRPMKHRTRESIFNLVTTDSVGRHAIDLFAGTGALGLEALSRGATSATLIEKHVPSARIVEENIRTLGVEGRAKLLVTSAFLWAKRDLPAGAEACTATGPDEQSGKHIASSASPPSDFPWLVFCSPPYAFFVDRLDDMLGLIQRIQTSAPADSVLVVEADERFDFSALLGTDDGGRGTGWQIRAYAPAVIGIWRKP
jgi:16S rRNA G966 N2-methylase RsmD